MKIKNLIAICMLLAALLATPAAAKAADGLPGHIGKFKITRPVSIWGEGQRLAIITDKELALYEGQEFPVLRDKEFTGMVYLTQIGTINAIGEFYPHEPLTLIRETDNIIIPKKNTLPESLSKLGVAQILYFSKTPSDLWVFIDAGTADGLTERTAGKAYRDGYHVGEYEMLFVGRHFSYGKLIREAIVPLAVVHELRILFPDIIEELQEKAGKNPGSMKNYPPGSNPYKYQKKKKWSGAKKNKSNKSSTQQNDEDDESGDILLSPF